MRKLLLLLLLFSTSGRGQDTLFLDEVLKAAAEHYPAIRQYDLLDRSLDFSLSSLNRGYLPQLNVTAQATYQSDVTALPFENLPFPSISIDPLDKDQYKVIGDVSQLIYDGGVISRQKNLERNRVQVEEDRLDVEMQRLTERVRQIYLGVLLLDGQLAQAELAGKDLASGTRRLEAAVRNGTAFRSHLSVMQVEELKNEQRITEMRLQRKRLLSSLSLLTGRDISEKQTLAEPEAAGAEDTPSVIRRPELNVFSSQIALTVEQKKLAGSRILPRFSLFAQGGYGRPGLNFLDNNFAWFYIAGARVNWNLGAFYTLHADRSQAALNGEIIASQRDAWKLNAELTVMQYQSDIEKSNRLLEDDERIVVLRDEIIRSARTQLDQGVITGSDYLREVNAGDQARLTRILHRLQLLQVRLELADYLDSSRP